MTPRYACGRCGKRGTAETMVYSRHTGNRYCFKLDECARRTANKKRRATSSTATMTPST